MLKDRICIDYCKYCYKDNFNKPFCYKDKKLVGLETFSDCFINSLLEKVEYYKIENEALQEKLKQEMEEKP